MKKIIKEQNIIKELEKHLNNTFYGKFEVKEDGNDLIVEFIPDNFDYEYRYWNTPYISWISVDYEELREEIYNFFNERGMGGKINVSEVEEELVFDGSDRMAYCWLYVEFIKEGVKKMARYAKTPTGKIKLKPEIFTLYWADIKDWCNGKFGVEYAYDKDRQILEVWDVGDNYLYHYEIQEELEDVVNEIYEKYYRQLEGMFEQLEVYLNHYFAGDFKVSELGAVEFIPDSCRFEYSGGNISISEISVDFEDLIEYIYSFFEKKRFGGVIKNVSEVEYKVISDGNKEKLKCRLDIDYVHSGEE